MTPAAVCVPEQGASDVEEHLGAVLHHGCVALKALALRLPSDLWEAQTQVSFSPSDDGQPIPR